MVLVWYIFSQLHRFTLLQTPRNKPKTLSIRLNFPSSVKVRSRHVRINNYKNSSSLLNEDSVKFVIWSFLKTHIIFIRYLSTVLWNCWTVFREIKKISSFFINEPLWTFCFCWVFLKYSKVADIVALFSLSRWHLSRKTCSLVLESTPLQLVNQRKEILVRNCRGVWEGKNISLVVGQRRPLLLNPWALALHQGFEEWVVGQLFATVFRSCSRQLLQHLGLFVVHQSGQEGDVRACSWFRRSLGLLLVVVVRVSLAGADHVEKVSLLPRLGSKKIIHYL